jgi:hypothetical protein
MMTLDDGNDVPGGNNTNPISGAQDSKGEAFS